MLQFYHKYLIYFKVKHVISKLDIKL